MPFADSWRKEVRWIPTPGKLTALLLQPESRLSEFGLRLWPSEGAKGEKDAGSWVQDMRARGLGSSYGPGCRAVQG